MPEGPEVSIITEQLRVLVGGKTLKEFKVIGKSKQAEGIAKEAAKLHLPQFCVDIKYKGKILYFWFQHKDIDLFLFVNLGLSGQFYLLENGYVPKHPVAEFHFEDGMTKTSIVYEDQRHFGKFRIFTTNELNKELDRLGPSILLPDPRPNGPNPADYANRADFIKKAKLFNKRDITAFLMKQTYFSGIGNYIKSEALYAAKIQPDSIPADINDEKLGELFDHIRRISMNAKRSGGVSVQIYRDTKRQKGNYQPVIYKRKQDPSGHKVLTGTFADGRTTYYVGV